VLHKQAGHTTVLTKRCEIAENLLQCRGHPHKTFVRPAANGFEPKCMYRLLFASVQLHVFRKSLICIRPLLISHLIYDDHLGSQTLGAPYSVPYN
jgi:hypothetical protein